ncbi:MAG: potassium-transporting ATPase subunit KdpC [Janthinobacterium lividum]
MGSEFLRALRPAFVLTLLLTLLLGVAYPFVVLGIGQALLPVQANGSLVMDNGKVVGSSLIGQGFASPRYFHGRPSAAGKGYDANSSSGSNLGPTSKALHDRIAGDIAALRKDGVTGAIPADLVTASASGLDPDISPAAATIQVSRVAKARNMSEAAVGVLVENAVVAPSFGIIGEPHVNVLALNRALDAAGAKP